VESWLVEPKVAKPAVALSASNSQGAGAGGGDARGGRARARHGSRGGKPVACRSGVVLGVVKPAGNAWSLGGGPDPACECPASTSMKRFGGRLK
jgi:hypothetical protein